MIKKIFILAFAFGISCSLWAKTSVSQSGSTVTLSNNRVKVEFATADKFDILSMTLSEGKQLAKPGNNKSIWAITYKGLQGETPEIKPEYAFYQGCDIVKGDTAVTLNFRWNTKLNYEGNPYPVVVSVTLTDNATLLAWNLKAALPQGWIVNNFSFPNIALAAPKAGKVITSGGWGNEYQLRENGVYIANYPSYSASMQLIMMDDGQGAFYYSTEDYNACGKQLCAEKKCSNVRFYTQVVASAGWSKNGTFTMPWTTKMGYHPDGWSQAALTWYRPWALTTEWGSKTLAERNIPKWLVEKDLWLRAKYLNDTTVAAVNKSIDYFGDNILFHWYFWHHYSYDSHYPDYFPAQEKFAPIIVQVQKRNCQVLPYINGRLWDPAAGSYIPMNGKDASCRKADGTLYTEVYPTSNVPNTVTCPSSPIWKNVILSLADRIQNELHTNGLYIDQIAAAAPQPCYAANHPHPAGGGEFWYHSYRDMMKELRDYHLKKNNVVFSEENAECYIPSFDILLTVNTPHSPDCKIVPLYPLIYSDRVLTSAFTYTPYTDVRENEFRYENMMCFLYGSQLGWVDPRLLWVDEKSEYEASFLRNLVELRKKQHDVFIGGHYIKEIIPGGDNPEIDVPVFGRNNVVKGAEWQSPKGKHVIYIVNSDSKPHEVTLPSGQTIKMDPISGKRINL